MIISLQLKFDELVMLRMICGDSSVCHVLIVATFRALINMMIGWIVSIDVFLAIDDVSGYFELVCLVVVDRLKSRAFFRLSVR